MEASRKPKVLCFNTSHVKVQFTAKRSKGLARISFNTSHVKVQLCKDFGGQFFLSVSIHHMLRFSIMCCRHLWKRRSFNTSHVKVQWEKPGSSAKYRSSFNTSHVKVQYLVVLILLLQILCFNTSHVKVQLLPPNLRNFYW